MGDKYPYENDAVIPDEISEMYSIPKVAASVCLEGGGIEINGNGTLMAAKTSIINENRNPTLSQEEIEMELTKYLGVTNFIWITGIRGEDNYDEDTDYHIDGAARFVNENTILYEYDRFQGRRGVPFGCARKALSRIATSEKYRWKSISTHPSTSNKKSW